MMDFDWIGATGIAVISSYVTLAVVAEAQPIIDEDGYEDYTLPGYLLLAGAFVIKWAVKTVAKIIRYYRSENKGSVIADQSVEGNEGEEDSTSFISEYELVI